MEEQLAGRLFLLLVSATIDYVPVSAAIMPIILPTLLASCVQCRDACPLSGCRSAAATHKSLVQAIFSQ